MNPDKRQSIPCTFHFEKGGCRKGENCEYSTIKATTIPKAHRFPAGVAIPERVLLAAGSVEEASEKAGGVLAVVLITMTTRSRMTPKWIIMVGKEEEEEVAEGVVEGLTDQNPSLQAIKNPNPIFEIVWR